MQIRIPKEKFELIKDFIRVAEEHSSTGIILKSKDHFERYSEPKEK